jgi:ABC-2 type transport system ATP-binding protein
MMAAIDVVGLSYRYGATLALDELSMRVPEGSTYALLGPNGSGKTTFMQILTGMRRATQGTATVLGSDVHALTVAHRQRVSYVAEGQKLPQWMRLEQLEAYLSPLYPKWDFALAAQLRERFGLDPKKKLGSLSRGTAMKKALLCALAPRPELLIMDEPFTGMDAIVKDELVRGLLDTASSDGWTVLLCSHDIAEVELLADWVGLLRDGRMTIEESMESLRARFRRVEVVASVFPASAIPTDALRVERAGQRCSFITTTADDAERVRAVVETLGEHARVDIHELSLRELFVALAGGASSTATRADALVVSAAGVGA